MIYLIALICFSLPSYLIRFSVFGIPTTALELLIYIAAVATLILKIKNQKQKTQTKNEKISILDSKFLIPIGLFLLAGIISAFVSPDKRAGLGLFKAYIFDPILFFVILIVNLDEKKKSEILNSKIETSSKLKIQNSKQKLKIGNYLFRDRSRKRLEILLKSLILSGAIVAIHAIWQRITGQITPDGRVIGLFGYSPNYLALYLAPITVLTIGYCLFRVKSRKLLIIRKNLTTLLLYIFITLILFLALYFSGSRAGIGAVIIGLISFFILKYWFWIKSRKLVLLFLCFFILLLLFGGWQLIKPNWQLKPEEGGRITSSNNIRWEIWKTTVKDIIPKDNNWLLGVGLGNYQNHFTELTKDRVNFPEWIAPRALTPHNLFLTIWLNLGLLGLMAFIWLLTLFFLFAIRSIRYSRGSGVMLAAAMITIIAHGLIDTPYWKNDLAMMFWIFLALVYISVKIRKEGYV